MLAHRAGYCDRLIRKAEAGQPLSMETVATIAEALSCQGFEVHVDDLLFSPQQSLQAFFGLLSDRMDSNSAIMGRNVNSVADNVALDSFSQFLSSTITCECTGPKELPFTGTHAGLSNAIKWVQTLVNSLQVVPDARYPMCAVEGELGFLSLLVTRRPTCDPSSKEELVVRFEFDRCKLSRIALNANLRGLLSGFD